MSAEKDRPLTAGDGSEVQVTILASSPGVEVVADPPHKCALPGWLERRRLGVRYESTVQCRECGQRWRWHVTYAGPTWMEVCP